MDEQQYKKTYHDVNPQRCIFEKAINSRVCNCAKAQRFNLADREGVACNSSVHLERCKNFSVLLHHNAKFVVQKLDNVQSLGHTQELKIQNGGLLGLQAEINSVYNSKVENIDNVIEGAIKRYSTLEAFPYSKIMQTIQSYQVRKRKVRKP